MTPESMPAGAFTAVTEEPGGPGGEQLQPQPLRGRAGGFRQQLRVLHEFGHPDGLDVSQRFGHGQNQGSGRRPTRFAGVAAFLFLFEIEIKMRQRGVSASFHALG